MPTTLTATYEQLLAVTENLGNHYKEATGARFVGFIMRSIFTETFKGAQNPTYMRDPGVEEFHSWQEAAKGMLNKIAIAPERDGVEDLYVLLQVRCDSCTWTLRCDI